METRLTRGSPREHFINRTCILFIYLFLIGQNLVPAVLLDPALVHVYVSVCVSTLTQDETILLALNFV